MIATALADQIKASFDALGLILVFVTVIFGVKYSAIWNDIRSPIPDPARKMDRRNHRRRLWHTFFTGCAPLFVITGAAWFLLLPLFVHVAGESFHPWSLTVTRNAFLFVAGMTGVFFAWSAGFAIAILWRIASSRYGGRARETSTPAAI